MPNIHLAVQMVRYCATAEAIAVLGATPVFVDVKADPYNMCAESLKRAVLEIQNNSDLSAKAVIMVDIFGQSADYPILAPIARSDGLKILADSAQGFGTQLNGRQPLYRADAATTSFFRLNPWDVMVMAGLYLRIMIVNMTLQTLCVCTGEARQNMII